MHCGQKIYRKSTSLNFPAGNVGVRPSCFYVNRRDDGFWEFPRFCPEPSVAGHSFHTLSRFNLTAGASVSSGACLADQQNLSPRSVDLRKADLRV